MSLEKAQQAVMRAEVPLSTYSDLIKIIKDGREDGSKVSSRRLQALRHDLEQRVLKDLVRYKSVTEADREEALVIVESMLEEGTTESEKVLRGELELSGKRKTRIDNVAYDIVNSRSKESGRLKLAGVSDDISEAWKWSVTDVRRLIVNRIRELFRIEIEQ